MISIENCIKDFIASYTEKIEAISKLKCDIDEIIFKKLLYSALIDALSKTATFKHHDNNKRYVDFLQNFANWNDGNRVSSTHFLQFLNKHPHPEFSKLKEYMLKKADSLFPYKNKHSIIHQRLINQDPTIGEVKKYLPPNISNIFGKFDIEKFTHYRLFYQNRNSLVHQASEAGRGFELEDDKNKTPYYYGQIDKNGSLVSIELIYPIDFYYDICMTCIDNLEKFYTQNSINPFKYLKRFTFYIDDLNI